MAKKTPENKKPRAPKVETRVIARAIAKGASAIDSGQLLNALIRRWGGPERFAADIFDEFQQAGEGSLARQRILEMMTRLTVQVTSQEIAKPKPVSDLTDAELLASATQLLEKLHGPRTAGPAETP